MAVTDPAAALAEFAKESQRKAISLLEQIVNIDSCSANPSGVDQVAAVLEAGLKSAGCSTERIAPPKSAEESWLAEFFLPEIGSFDLVAHHLIGRYPGTGRGHVMLIGHMDTAFPRGEPEQNPFQIRDDKAYGCAIMDMKGGLVVILQAIKALAETGLQAPKITIVYDSDEQAGSLTARNVIERIAQEEGVNWAFKAEAGIDGGKLRNRRPALGVGLVEVEGTERHVGTGFWEGSSAIIALARKAIALQDLSVRADNRIVNVGEIHGGTRRNLVAGYARAKLDIRARTQTAWDALANEVMAIAEGVPQAGTTARAKVFNHRPAMEPTEKTEELMRVVETSAQALGQQPVEYVEAAAGSDANFTAALGIPTLDGFGPHGANTMTRDEYIVVDSLPQRVALLAATLHRLGELAPPEG